MNATAPSPNALSTLRHTATVLHGLADDHADAKQVADLRQRAAALIATRETMKDLFNELCLAHLIIRAALNCITGADRERWFAQIAAEHLDGEGTTRANERDQVLARATGGAA